MNAYDPTEPGRRPGLSGRRALYFHNSLIWGENLTNVSITGHGHDQRRRAGAQTTGCWIDMCGFSTLESDQSHAHPETQSLRPSGSATRPSRSSSAATCCIRDITIFHGGHFAILVTGCDNLTVDNVTMDTDRDGIDIDCCRNTMVSNCRINSPRDDGLCPKSTFALGRNVITENLTIVNCQVSGFQEGTLLDGTMKPARGTTAASNSAPRPTAVSATAPWPTARSAAATAWRWKKWTAASWKTSPSTTSP